MDLESTTDVLLSLSLSLSADQVTLTGGQQGPCLPSPVEPIPQWRISPTSLDQQGSPNPNRN